jgi:hypothetical protein
MKDWKWEIDKGKLTGIELCCDSILFALDNAVLDNYIFHKREGRFMKE